MTPNKPDTFDSIVDSVAEDLYVILPLLGRILRSKLGKIPSSQFDTKLSLSHMKIIQVLHEGGARRVSEVADALFIPRPQMTYLVDRLVKYSLVERSLDSADRRTVNVSLTEKGKAMVGEQGTLFRDALKSAVSDLGMEEVQQLSESLKKLKELLTKIG
jgi:DNA-binding MarR family transcriptional regulator